MPDQHVGQGWRDEKRRMRVGLLGDSIHIPGAGIESEDGFKPQVMAIQFQSQDGLRTDPCRAVPPQRRVSRQHLAGNLA